MKELSIKDKAKRYDEAIERAKSKIKNDKDHVLYEGDVIEIFPELKESEDEMIRKAIIEHFAGLHSSMFPYRGFTKEQILAWLEKQGKNDSQVIFPQFTFDDILALQCCMETAKKIQEDKDLYEKLKDLHGRVYEAYQLKKQCDNANKVEPKFSLYDWVVTDKGDTVQIGAVNNGYYTLFNGMDFNMSYVDKCWHKWTIKDAKEGVVLAGKIDGDSYILIYKQIKDGWMETYGHYYDSVDKFCVPTQLFCREGNGTFCPATKEQRDLLFQKMKEDGYEWDADEKVLNKVIIYEQK